jgi:hypothetical protein
MLKRHLIQQVYFLKAFLPNPSGHDIAETLLAPRYIQRVVKNPLLEVISLHGPTGPLKHRGSNIMVMVATYNTLKTGKYWSMKNNNR